MFAVKESKAYRASFGIAHYLSEATCAVRCEEPCLLQRYRNASNDSCSILLQSFLLALALSP